MSLPRELRDRLTVYQDHQEWLASRKARASEHGIGSSDVAAILGVSPYSTPWTVWASAHIAEEDAEEDAPETEDMLRGRYWEPFLARWYRDQRICFPVSTRICTVRHRRYPWLIVSPDGLAFDRQERTWGVLEIKTQRYREGWGRDGEDVVSGHRSTLQTIPPYYLTQAQILMEATGLDWCDFVVGFGFADIRRIRVRRDPRWELAEQVAAWRDRHLVAGEPPPWDPQDTGARLVMLTHPRKGSRSATPEEVGLVYSYAEAAKAAKAAEEDRIRIRAELTRACAMTGVERLTLPTGQHMTLTTKGAIRLPRNL